MDISIEKAADITLGSLFQQIINDMKNSSPLWEDFIVKATKLHACLRAAIQAISSYLEAFQKIADAATNSKGASKEIGTALTRVCLRHKAVETRLKTFTTAIMDSLIIPMQDKLEEWKRQVVILDKDHTKEYKRCRNELKKRSSDTLRLQKKAKKGASDNLQSLMDSSFASVNQQKAELDEVERKSLRMAMIEDRTRFCHFVHMLQPVVKQEYEMMYELGHLQEAMLTVTNVTKDPTALPQASEELIAESKTSFNLYPESPTHSSSQGCSNSLGSRKSSVCSISSMNSSGSSGSPGHQFHQRSLSQYNPTIRLKPGESTESRDSGFCSSSPALTIQASTATNQSHAISTWPPPGAQETVSNDRPHTISSAYERHQRPALTVYTFQNPDQNINEISNSNSNISNGSGTSAQKSPASVANRPPLPIRCSSLERPLSATATGTTTPIAPRSSNTSARPSCPSPIPAHVAKAEQLDAIDTVELDNLIGELDLFQKEHEAKQQERMQKMQNGYHNNCEYQIPNPITATTTIITHQNSLNNNNINHNDSFISTSTTITHAFSNGTANSVHASDDSETNKSASLNYSITSTISSDVQKFTNCSDSVEPCYNDTDLSSDTGFENPSFRHLNDTSSSSSNIVLIRDDDLPSSYYTRNSTDAVVVLRSKGLSSSNNNSMTDLSQLETPTFEQKFQRLSSFKFENNNLSYATPNGSPSHYYSSSNNINNNSSSSPSIPSVSKGSLSSHGSFGALMYGQIEEPALTANATSNVNVNNNMNVVTTTASHKPTLAPRPASLMSGASRIARRSSVNTVKPPPPVRRSSSATPSHYSDSNTSQTNNLQTQQQLNNSSEALPAPPEYMLRANPPQPHQNNAKPHYMTTSTSVGQIASTISNQSMKMINELRQSPGVMRRQLSLINHSSSNHSQPTNTHSITYSSQPSTPKLEKDANSSSMFSIYGITTGSNGTYNNNTSNSNDVFGTMPRQQKQPHGIYAQPKQMSTVSSFRTSSSPNSNPPAQPPKSTGLLASLTARITPNKSSQNQQPPPQQQQQIDYERARNEPIYQRHSSNQSNQSYYDAQQQSIYGERPSDGKNQNQNYSSQSSHNQQQYQQQQQHSVYNQNIYASTNPFITPPTQNHSSSSFGKDVTGNYSNYQTGNYNSEKSDSVLSKTAPGFLDNLNAKLAEQRANNKAYAVRSYINSKVVPDPRIVRESLMDQIRRGADLKRAVNDPR